MKSITDLITSSNKYKNVTVQKEFNSKKNTVAYVTINNKPRVFKWFVPGLKNNMKNEYAFLKEGSSKINMPSIYEMDESNNLLIMNYISGENLCDIFNDEKTSKSEKQRLVIILAEWLYTFHNYFKKDEKFRIHGDPTIRNFILSDKLWGVDFEESRIGKPEEDIAGICASILTTNPMFTSEKIDLCKKFIDSYIEFAPGRISNINEEIAYSILKKIQWRPDDEEILKNYSKKIRKKGLNI